MLVAIGLGSNLGDRVSYLSSAVKELAATLNDIKLSGIYESDALLRENSPKEWNKNFLNMVVAGESALSSKEIFSFIKKLEKKLGRKDKKQIWGPREIDLDFILYGNEIITEKDFNVPHKSMAERPFVIWPLAEILPQWKHPQKKQTAMELAQKFGAEFPECKDKPGNIFNTSLTNLKIDD